MSLADRGSPARTATVFAAFLAFAGALASGDADPWTRVPALPTGAYQSDGGGEKFEAARELASRDLSRQEKINNEIGEKVRTLDPMEIASRQQQYMMEHPQEAMKLMQRSQQVREDATPRETAAEEERKRLLKDLEDVDARYKAALDKQLAAVDAKYRDLETRAAKDRQRTEGGDFYKPWAVTEFNAIQRENNAAYEALASTWWSATGPYHGWLEAYRAHLAKLVPEREEAELVGAGFQAQIVGTPEASFKPTAGLRAVRDYLEQAVKVFAKRRPAALKPVDARAVGEQFQP